MFKLCYIYFGDYMDKITPLAIKFIKLGQSGEWEHDCLSSGTVRFGYQDTPDELCVEGRWEEVRQLWLELRNGNEGTASRDVEQIKTFYTANENTVFITFNGGFLYWCRPMGIVKVLDDGSRVRKTVDGWKNISLGGNKLSMDCLSGQLLKVQGYRGTICNVSASDYVIRKINDELLPQVSAAIAAERNYMNAIIELCKLLTWQDFELLVDLIFTRSGWRRTGIVGKTQKTVDLELELPTTGERAFVQVKSEANPQSLKDYADCFKNNSAFTRMFFVWHSGSLAEDEKIEGVALIGPNKLAELILNSGLSEWLRKKVS